MNQAYARIKEIFVANNLQNHVGNITCELINNGTGFKISCSDWVVFFNEYGTGIANNKDSWTRDSWTYYKDGTFHTTYGQEAKHMFGKLEHELNEVAGEFYNTAISYALDQKSYGNFVKELRKIEEEKDSRR